MSTKGKRAVITGVYGQDGSYLAEILLGLGYSVLGIARESERCHPMSLMLAGHKDFSVLHANLTNTETIIEATRTFLPDEIYNFAAVSDLKTAEEHPDPTYAVNHRAFSDIAFGAYKENPRVHIFQALSSRILQPDEHGVIDEMSQLKEPVNMYDKAKRESYEKVVIPLREKGCFITSAFLCNHESPRRGERFVTGKIAKTVVAIKRGTEQVLTVGNVEALRDWSHAHDVVRGVHAILTASTPRDYVIGSGELHSVREFISEAFMVAGIALTWEGGGIARVAYDEQGVLRVRIDPAFYRPDDNPVVSNTSRLEHDTHWRREYTFKDLVRSMVDAELTMPT